jgi:filamentous hemagglutinin family protein
MTPKTIMMLYIGLVSTALAEGQTITDGTMGAVQNLGSSSFVIPQSLGRTVGNNLFHSFSAFNVNTGQSAVFTGDNHIQNVITRVTGGQRSTIDGLLQSQVGRADFYFINPAGVTFGGGGSLDVPAAFHVSTADKMTLGKEGVFYADLSKDSQLSSEPPSAFGFLASSSATNSGLIDIDHAKLALQDGKVFDAVARAITIVGSGTEFHYGAANVTTTTGQARFVALKGAGEVTLVPNNIGVLALPVDDTEEHGGDITVSRGVVDTSGNGAGRIGLYGGNINITSIATNDSNVVPSFLFSDNNTGDTLASDAKGIEINAYNFNLTGSELFTRANSAPVEDATVEEGFKVKQGNAANIVINAKNNIEFERAQISSSTFTDGNAGNVKISANNIKLQGGDISTDAEDVGMPVIATGNGGTITINAKDTIEVNAVIIKDSNNKDSLMDGNISSSTSTNGNAGNVTISANNIKLQVGGRISTSTHFGGRMSDVYDNHNKAIFLPATGNGGTITINANDTIEVNGYIYSFTSTNGNAGNVTISANNIKLQGGDILTDAGVVGMPVIATGNGGTITINAKDTIEVNAVIIKDSNNNDSLWNGNISSSTSTNGNAGRVTMSANNIKLQGGSISTNTDAPYMNYYDNNDMVMPVIATSSGGIITINAKDTIELNGVITKNSDGSESLQGGQISSSTSTKGNAGNVTISANNIKLQGGGISTSARRTEIHDDYAGRINEGALTAVLTTGNGGDVIMNAKNNIELDGVMTKDIYGNENLQGGQISSSTSTNGNAGNVTISANNIKLQGGGISTNADNLYMYYDYGTSAIPTGNGGDVIMNAKNNIELDGVMTKDLHGNENLQGGQISSSTSTNGNAGSVTMSANNIKLLQYGTISTSTQGPSIYDLRIPTLGHAGEINIKADDITIADKANITSGSFRNKSSGLTGHINVNAGNLTVASGGTISIENEAMANNPQDINVGEIKIDAKNIRIDNATINSSSTGNVNAGRLTINYTNFFKLTRNAFLNATSEDDGNGGFVSIFSPSGALFLKDSQIATTATGLTSNGGDIDIASDVMVLDTASLLASTVGGQGGNITLNEVEAIVPSRNNLTQVGSAQFKWQPYTGKNVLGASGTINITPPQFNLSGVLASSNIEFKNDFISQDYCALGQGSSLSKKGKGGLPMRAKDLQVF